MFEQKKIIIIKKIFEKKLKIKNSLKKIININFWQKKSNIFQRHQTKANKIFQK